jgi:hypothetical protein
MGAGAEMNLNTRNGPALGYGAAVDRTIGSSGLIAAGLRAALETDFSGVSGTEANLYFRLYLYKRDFGGLYTQLGWGYSAYREDLINAQTMLLDFTAGYRVFFLGGFYVEPYFRTGFPFRLGVGLMAGHWFDF